MVVYVQKPLIATVRLGTEYRPQTAIAHHAIADGGVRLSGLHWLVAVLDMGRLCRPPGYVLDGIGCIGQSGLLVWLVAQWGQPSF